VTSFCRLCQQNERQRGLALYEETLLTYYTYIQNKPSVAQAKTSVEKLLLGQVFNISATRVCRQYFFHQGSVSFLDNVMRTHSIHIVQDRQRMNLRLYGDQENVSAAEKTLAEKADALNSQSKSIILDSNTLSFALRGGFRYLVGRFGKDVVKMDITSNPKCIIVIGPEQLATEVEKHLLLYEADSPERSIRIMSLDDKKDEELCPVCWTPPEEPFTTKCGDTYCGECLSSQCTSANEFPINCLGDSAKCNRPVSLDELEQVLPAGDYEILLQASFTNYIRSHPSNFQYCSTPDCDHFYRTSPKEDPRTFTCEGCLASICTGCNQATHEGLSCAANKSMHEGTSEFAKWKREHDVRDCPKCQVPIEKTYGCNHMECQACKIHICWYCMKTFELSKPTYDHMSEKHQGAFPF
jgi:hypothetical protein